jgi:hypothetical protein
MSLPHWYLEGTSTIGDRPHNIGPSREKMVFATGNNSEFAKQTPVHVVLDRLGRLREGAGTRRSASELIDTRQKPVTTKPQAVENYRLLRVADEVIVITIVLA